MGTKQFKFKEQVSAGEAGEALFLAGYHMPLERIPKHWGDFRREDGRILELKTDYHPHASVSGFFIEYYSDLENQKIGGPWQAFEKGATVLCYLFAKDGLYYEFEELPKLLSRLTELIKDGRRPVYIRNPRWITTGYKVPREEVSDLYSVHKIET